MQTRIFPVLMIFFGILLCSSVIAAEAEPKRLVVHEWGTFTTLQDFEGKDLYGINIDDEPVPAFVHNLQPHLLDHAVLSQAYWQFRQKAAPRQHPHVSMRLETPVIYFYPPATAKLPIHVDVDVRFRGGWLTEFYPDAVSKPDENASPPFKFSELTSKTVGRLTWTGLQIGKQGTFPTTREQVWLAPRQVSSAPLKTPSGESEQYLFYRGVAKLHSPLRVATKNNGSELEIRANFKDVLQSEQSDKIAHLWLMETKANHTSAFRRLDSVIATNDPGEALSSAPRRFSPEEFASSNRGELEREMHQALTSEGLFADEATALLTTWQRAYFESSGLRVFYTVPRSWTDHYLPLAISGEPSITRVMIGRVELVSDAQQETLQSLSEVDTVSNEWIEQLPQSPAKAKLMAGRLFDLQDLGYSIPDDFRLYMKLGRFRNALIVEEERKTKDENLSRFIGTYGLSSFQPASE
jgi:hypothetical protein